MTTEDQQLLNEHLANANRRTEGVYLLLVGRVPFYGFRVDSQNDTSIAGVTSEEKYFATKEKREQRSVRILKNEIIVFNPM